MNEDYCPHCGACMIGEPIPQNIRKYYASTHFSRKIGVEVSGVYDGVLYWKCPDCGGRWHRFGTETSSGRNLRTLAEPYVNPQKVKPRAPR